MEVYGQYDCMEGDGKLSENYKQHLWGKGLFWSAILSH